MPNFRVILENAELKTDFELSEVLKDDEHPTTVNNTKQYIANQLNVNYYDICAFLIFDKLKTRVHDDYEIRDDDVIFVKVETKNNNVPKLLKTGVKNPSHENALNQIITKISAMQNQDKKQKIIDKIAKHLVNEGKTKNELPSRRIHYEGELNNGEYSGYGKLTIRSRTGKIREIYEGNFKDGNYYGYGRLELYEDGKISIIDEGNWENGTLNGFGIHEEIDCLKYEGNLEGGVFNGQGKMEDYETGRIYEGNFVCDLFKGQGKMIFPNGDIYQGEWGEIDDLNCCIVGYGKMAYANGDIYEGEWTSIPDKDKKFIPLRSGYGKMTYANGDVYEGTWIVDFDENGNKTSVKI